MNTVYKNLQKFVIYKIIYNCLCIRLPALPTVWQKWGPVRAGPVVCACLSEPRPPGRCPPLMGRETCTPVPPRTQDHSQPWDYTYLEEVKPNEHSDQSQLLIYEHNDQSELLMYEHNDQSELSLYDHSDQSKLLIYEQNDQSELPTSGVGRLLTWQSDSTKAINTI